MGIGFSNYEDLSIKYNESEFGIDPSGGCDYGIYPHQKDYGIYPYQKDYGICQAGRKYGIDPTNCDYGLQSKINSKSSLSYRNEEFVRLGIIETLVDSILAIYK